MFKYINGKDCVSRYFSVYITDCFLRLVFKFVPRLSLSFRFREEGRPSGCLRKVIKKRPIFRGMRKGKQAQYCRKESAERLRGEQSSLTKEESKEKLSAKEGRGGGEERNHWSILEPYGDQVNLISKA